MYEKHNGFDTTMNSAVSDSSISYFHRRLPHEFREICIKMISSSATMFFLFFHFENLHILFTYCVLYIRGSIKLHLRFTLTYEKLC